MLNVANSPDETSADERLKAFGQQLRLLRKQSGLSLEVVAKNADVDRGFLGGVERGERNVGLVKVFAIADALKVDPGDLFADL